jgi:hypothetical protein
LHFIKEKNDEKPEKIKRKNLKNGFLIERARERRDDDFFDVVLKPVKYNDINI